MGFREKGKENDIRILKYLSAIALFSVILLLVCSTANAQNETVHHAPSRAKKLIDILPERLKKDLKSAEKTLLERAEMGKMANFLTDNEKKKGVDLGNADNWDDDRKIRSNLLVWLCTDDKAVKLVHKKGVKLKGAAILNKLNFDNRTLAFPLTLTECAIPKGISLEGTQLHTLQLVRCLCGSILGEGLYTRHNFRIFDTRVQGPVRLRGANIGGILSFRRSTLNKCSIDLENAQIKRKILLNELKCPVMKVDLTHASVGQLTDDEKSWPPKEKLLLEGFRYGAFAGDSPREAKYRIKWLELQPGTPFRPQPYLQLAKVLRSMGMEDDAREVLIAKQEALRKHGGLSGFKVVSNWILGFTIDHGYKPWKVFRFIGTIILLGILLFRIADRKKIMQPSNEHAYNAISQGQSIPKNYPRFNSLLYSIDLFVPFINFHQQSYWLPDADRPYGRFCWWYIRFHILMGWTFSTLAVVGLTGLVAK